MLTPRDIQSYVENGYLHVRGVFSQQEIERFSAAGHAHPGTLNASISTLEIDQLRNVWCDARLLTIAQQILGDQISFFLETSYSRMIFPDMPTERSQHLHHDAKGTKENLFSRLHTVPEAPYPVVRFGIYFQDYTKLSGSLKVSPGSHLIPTDRFDQSELAYFDVPSVPGDVVCFSLRTLHSGLALRLRDAPNVALSPVEEELTFNESPQVFFPFPKEREAIFIDYAACNEASDLFIKNRSHYLDANESGISTRLDIEDVSDRAARSEVRLRVDKMIVDCVLQIYAALRDKKKEVARSLLLRLPALVRRNREFSACFRLFDGDVGDDSLESGRALYRAMLPRVAAQQKMFSTRLIDYHMSSQDGAEA